MPSFELKHTDEFKRWLIRELEPVCDADPEVLSDYVLALLKHDGSDSDLHATLLEQLEDFLADQTTAFVDKTLNALRSESYLPATKRIGSLVASASTQSNAGPSRKRAADDEGRDMPAKAPRDSDQFESGRRREFDGRERDENGGAPHHRADGGQRKKQMCRDFHQRGFCSRGDSCRFDHSLPTPAEGSFPMRPMVGGGQLPMPPQHPPQPGMQPPFPFPGQHFPAPPQGMPWNGQQQAPPFGAQSHDGQTFALPPNGEGGAFMPAHPRPDFGFGGRGGRGGHMRGSAGRGGGGGRGTFEKRPTSDTTLVIENVPEEHLELVKVNEYFKKFGTITNIQIDVDGKKALVSYAKPAEAKAAHTSPEVIFNNRFVKVYFQKLDDPFVKPKEAPTAPVAPPLKNNFIPGQTSNKFVRPNLAVEKAKEAHDAAQKKLDDLMSEQKDLMSKLMGGQVTADEKKGLMARFSTLEVEIKAATEEVRNAVSGVTAAPKANAVDAGADWKDQREKKDREQLDRELEVLKTGSADGSTTEELKATLARLEAEAEQLGIDANDPSSSSFAFASQRGGYRGRGRAAFRGAGTRGYHAPYRGGRGGSSFGRPTMSLDNRTSKLHITDVPGGASSDAGTKVKEHLKQFGEVHAVEDREDGTFIVHYKARTSGERAVRAGLNIPDVGSVKAQWTNEGGSYGGASSNEVEEAGPDHEDNHHGEEETADREDNFRR